MTGTDRHSRVRVLGQQVRISIREGDDADARARPLLLCNGIGASLDLLTPFVDALPPSIEVVRFDVPGVGGSPLPNLPYTFSGLAILLGRMLDKLGYERADVLGISWGGALAQQFAFQNPRRCRRLVLVSTGTGSLMIPGRPSVLRKMTTPRRYHDLEYLKSIAADLYGGKLRRDPERIEQILHAQERLGPRRGYVLQLAAGFGWSSLPCLPLIRQQTLLLAGTDDPIVPVINARIMQRLLPHGVLHTYDDGHLAMITSAPTLAPLVADFLDAA